ncbi:hypothetical protein [Prevotella ihumii]|uniref:hypothetical protein n=1 Tax=Prevotella ihumii TaxID=1917878 RepID=UPI001180C9AF|nr:hypothetical protein [Prevotella ihumii]
MFESAFVTSFYSDSYKCAFVSFYLKRHCSVYNLVKPNRSLDQSDQSDLSDWSDWSDLSDLSDWSNDRLGLKVKVMNSLITFYE